MSVRFIKHDIKAAMGRRSGFLAGVKTLVSNPGCQVVVLYRLAQSFRTIKLKIVSTILMRLIYHLYHCDIRYTSQIGAGFTITHPIGVVIGGKVVAGVNFSIRQSTTIGGNSGKSELVKGNTITQPIIGDNVTLGCNCCLLGPIQVTDDCVLAAGAILVSNALTKGVYAGVPARLVKNYES